ncbi:MAG: ogr/Delta-like zinc finger family protein [Hafnia sp.]|nr:ogr/Delta-like zinc finger family protein [Hafnia paralvei]
MMRCSLCGQAAHARSSIEMTITTKERYYQCTNINCGHTFIAHETYVRSIVRPNVVKMVDPHPAKCGQAVMNF